MSKQTINIGASPNDGTGTPLRTSFDYTNQNFTELYTAVGPSGNNIVVPGNATITGDLTVDTSTLKVDSTNNRVGIGTASPGKRCEINQSANAITTIGAGEILRLIGDDGNVVSRITEVGFGSGPTGATYAPVVIGAVNTSISGFGTKDFYVATRAGIGDVAPLERYRIDSTGISTWSVAGSTAMTLNSTGLGIGGSPTEKLSVNGSIGFQNAATQRWHISATSGSDLVFTRSSVADRLTITSDGNVGIGVTPSAWTNQFMAIEGGDSNSQSAVSFQTNANAINLHSNSYYSTGYKYKFTGTAGQYALAGNQHEWYIAPSGTAGDAITFTQAMTLDASGRLLVGQTSTGLLNLNGIDIEGGDSNGGSYIIINHKLLTAAGQQYAFFAYSGVKTGDITQNGTTGVLYNTVSDYRLKESVKPISNGLARVNSLKPSSYNWKSDGSVGEGFIAHELAEAVPAAVSGEKDALNADGSINAQSVDMSRIIPILVAAIQELTTRVQTLEAR